MAIESTDPFFQLYLVYLRQADLFSRKILDPDKREQNYTEVCEKALTFADIAANVFQGLPPRERVRRSEKRPKNT